MKKYITISRLKYAHIAEGMGKSVKTIMQVFLCLSRFPVSFFQKYFACRVFIKSEAF
ncbi:hypothetical protein Hanom_Chr08g00709581 [Helianthus anomalus]